MAFALSLKCIMRSYLAIVPNIRKCMRKGTVCSVLCTCTVARDRNRIRQKGSTCDEEMLVKSKGVKM